MLHIHKSITFLPFYCGTKYATQRLLCGMKKRRREEEKKGEKKEMKYVKVGSKTKSVLKKSNRG